MDGTFREDAAVCCCKGTANFRRRSGFEEALVFRTSAGALTGKPM